MSENKKELKKYRLDLSEYTITLTEPERSQDGKLVIVDGQPATVKKEVDYPLRDNLSSWLRSAGMFRTAEDVAEAVGLAREIRLCTAEFLILDEKEKTVLRAVMNKRIEMTADGQDNVGGEIHEEAICRVVNMEVIEE